MRTSEKSLWQYTIKERKEKGFYPLFHLNITVHSGKIPTSISGIDKIRMYLSDDSAFTHNGDMPKPFLQYAVSGVWCYNCALPSGEGTQMVLNDIPANANVFRQDGKVFIHGVGDLDVSQYIYMNVIMPDHYPLHDYGVCGSGNLKICFLYDYADII